MIKALTSPRSDDAAARGQNVPRVAWPARPHWKPRSSRQPDLCFDPVGEQIVDGGAVERSNVHLGKRYFSRCCNCQSTFERSPPTYVDGRRRGPYL